MAGLVPAIHASCPRASIAAWMPATSAGMTAGDLRCAARRGRAGGRCRNSGVRLLGPRRRASGSQAAKAVRASRTPSPPVMAGLVPAIHAFCARASVAAWMPATSAGMTAGDWHCASRRGRAGGRWRNSGVRLLGPRRRASGSQAAKAVRASRTPSPPVMAGLVPAIHAFCARASVAAWMPATSAGMTAGDWHCAACRAGGRSGAGHDDWGVALRGFVLPNDGHGRARPCPRGWPARPYALPCTRSSAIITPRSSARPRRRPMQE
ncbi:hypothetical protein GGR16_001681 [Chelatococcus caeni]|uniref:Uncharacterized protein n=1 Tax=Chelatococcus caeni TaxID=1348468 RepID=A0A840BTF6_9HYPH|nr:hypothetical protein [Chelatococcus caeni]